MIIYTFKIISNFTIFKFPALRWRDNFKRKLKISTHQLQGNRNQVVQKQSREDNVNRKSCTFSSDYCFNYCHLCLICNGYCHYFSETLQFYFLILFSPFVNKTNYTMVSYWWKLHSRKRRIYDSGELDENFRMTCLHKQERWVIVFKFKSSS
jgi:hypothetical protein